MLQLVSRCSAQARRLSRRWKAAQHSIEWDEEATAQARKLFKRYDLDVSGTLNSNEERSQLATGLLFAWRDTEQACPIDTNEMEYELANLEALNEKNAWSFDDFRSNA